MTARMRYEIAKELRKASTEIESGTDAGLPGVLNILINQLQRVNTSIVDDAKPEVKA